jgi:hypothetical protein
VLVAHQAVDGRPGNIEHLSYAVHLECKGDLGCHGAILKFGGVLRFMQSGLSLVARAVAVDEQCQLLEAIKKTLAPVLPSRSLALWRVQREPLKRLVTVVSHRLAVAQDFPRVVRHIAPRCEVTTVGADRKVSQLCG